MGKGGPPHRFILPAPGSLSLPLQSLPPKTLCQAAVQEDWRLRDPEEPIATRRKERRVPSSDDAMPQTTV